MKESSTRAAFGASVLLLVLSGCFGSPADESGVEVTNADLSRICGGPRHLACGRDRVCHPVNPDHCLGPNEYGICVAKPRNQLCPQIFMPVCGCDGKTYPNACQAGQAGVIVASTGSCDGTACEGDFSCGDNSFCKSPTGACGTAGTCQSEPQVCPDLFKPVCGCDGKTYSNECNASGAGVSVQQMGACPTKQFCGGIAAFPCPGAGKCVDDPSDSCDPTQGGADCGGICTCIETQLCIRGDHFNSDPSVCACVPDATP